MATKKESIENASTCDQVEQTWLDAGRRGDYKAMQSLRKTHPKWLAFDRLVTTFESGLTYHDKGDEAPSFCDWEKFHLPTVGASALHAAAWDGNYDVLEFLLNEGQHVDERGRRGVTVLMVTLMRHNVQALRAVFRGSAVMQLNTVMDCRKEDAERLNRTLDVVKLLLCHGAKTEARDYEGKTALLLATNDELFEIAKLLLEKGAKIDAQDSAGRSPLHVCLRTCPEQSVLVTNLLVSHGAPIDLPDKAGETPLTIVIRRGDTTALQLLLNHHSLVVTPARQDFSGAVLLQAAELGVVEVVRFLLDSAYANIDVVNARGETALHLAIVKQHKLLVEILCAVKSAKLLLQARTQDKMESVLHYAARYGSPSDLQSVLSLLDKKHSNKVNMTNAVGSTPLYLATTVPAAESLNDRQVKAAQLEKFGASLFPIDFRLFREVNNDTAVALIAVNPAARRSLALWLVECSLSSPTTFSDFCIDWLTCVQLPQSDAMQMGDEKKQEDTKQPSVVIKPGNQTAIMDKEVQPYKRILLTPTIAAFVCAGYAVDAVPLLLTVPFKRDAMLRFFELLEALAMDTKHILLQKLQLELLAAWKIESKGSSRYSKPKMPVETSEQKK